MIMKEHDILRLPQWAQQHIRFLESQLDGFRTKLAEFEGKQETNTFMHSFGKDGMPTQSPLPNNSQIRFVLGEDYLDCYQKDGKVSIFGNTLIALHPRAANNIEIEVMGWGKK